MTVAAFELAPDARDAVEAHDKRVATARAHLALAGQTLHVIDGSRGGPRFLAAWQRAGRTRELQDIDAVAEYVHAVTGARI